MELSLWWQSCATIVSCGRARVERVPSVESGVSRVSVGEAPRTTESMRCPSYQCDETEPVDTRG